MTVQWSVKSTTWFETMCSQTKMMFPHSTLGWGKKVCHHSALHSFIVGPIQEERVWWQTVSSSFIKLAAFRMNFQLLIVEKTLPYHQKTGWGFCYFNMTTQHCVQSWQAHFTVNLKSEKSHQTLSSQVQSENETVFYTEWCVEVGPCNSPLRSIRH